MEEKQLSSISTVSLSSSGRVMNERYDQFCAAFRWRQSFDNPRGDPRAGGERPRTPQWAKHVPPPQWAKHVPRQLEKPEPRRMQERGDDALFVEPPLRGETKRSRGRVLGPMRPGSIARPHWHRPIAAQP